MSARSSSRAQGRPGPPERRLDRGIVLYPDFILTRPSQPLVEFDEAAAVFSQRLCTTRLVHRAKGVAAPQMGIPVRMFVFLDENGADRVVVNPEVVEASGEQIGREGCLSLPRSDVQVRRSSFVRVVGRTINDEPWEYETDDLLTVAAIEHELDHLDGVLIVDRCSRQVRNATIRRAAA